MPIKTWIQKVWGDQPLFKKCYIAIIQQLDKTYDLEVEVALDAIGGVYPTQNKSLANAKKLANELDTELSNLGVSVYKYRSAWEMTNI